MATIGRFLLDTNIVIALFAGEAAILERLAGVGEVFVPATVLGELYYGARKSARMAQNIARIDEFAGCNKILPCDAATAALYGNIKNQLRAKGRPIPENDIWIAAVALQYRLVLVARDAHFREIDGLQVEAW
jgi:tRNA(fMet)-specific endonuclease VapC